MPVLPKGCIAWGATAEPSVFSLISSGGFAVMIAVSLGVMGGRSNWSRIEQRRLMRRQRVEHVKGGPTFTTTLNKHRLAD
jgi:hypothetical protein